MSTAMTPERQKEIRAALDAVPAPPWHWIGDTKHQGPMLATKHSGWIYVMGFKRLGMRGAQPAFPVKGEDGYLLITPCREIEERSSVAAKDAAIPRASYDPDTVRGIDNPVARWLEHSAQYAKELLGEVDRLTAELKVAFGHGLYLDIQNVLDKALGTEEADGAGAGIVADVALVAERMQAAEAEVERLRADLKEAKDRAPALAAQWLADFDAGVGGLSFGLPDPREVADLKRTLKRVQAVADSPVEHQCERDGRAGWVRASDLQEALQDGAP